MPLVTCPNCSSTGKLPDSIKENQKITCPGCSHRFRYSSVELLTEPTLDLPEQDGGFVSNGAGGYNLEQASIPQNSIIPPPFPTTSSRNDHPAIAIPKEPWFYTWLWNGFMYTLYIVVAIAVLGLIPIVYGLITGSLTSRDAISFFGVMGALLLLELLWVAPFLLAIDVARNIRIIRYNTTRQP